MPDSTPPDLPPLEGLDLIASDHPGTSSLAWPAPPYPAYALSQPLLKGEECLIEGLNGRTMQAELIAFEPAMGHVMVRVPPSRNAMPLRLTQFRRVALPRILRPDPPPGQAHPEALIDFHPQVDYRVVLRDAPALSGKTIGHVETAQGLYLFPPVEPASDEVTRLFVPRDAYLSWDMGPSLGQQLLADSSATPDQIHAALAEQAQLRQQRVGDVLLQQKIVTPEQLATALDTQSRMPMVRIGEALVALGYISQPQLEAALDQQRSNKGLPLGELLVNRGDIKRHELRTALARKMGYPVVDVEAYPIDPAVISRLPLGAARRLLAVPLSEMNGRLVLAIDDPSKRQAIDEIEFITQSKVMPVLPIQEDMALLVQSIYARHGITEATATATLEGSGMAALDEGGTGKLLAALEDAPQERDLVEDKPVEQSDNSLVRLINTMIYEAHQQNVSDIHIEAQPGREKVRIRFRRDGVLRPYLELPHTYRQALLARIKIMCDLDISERRRPQDGKINFARFVPSCPIELRVATIPTNNNLEDAVLRILASAKPIPLANLGLSPANRSALVRAIERPYGMVLCVGPTGSGKTTTLHSAMAEINTPDRKIWTAEDPVEITQAGLRQVQVNPKIDWTFARALRAFLRADPDVIMVGEIRDAETAQIAVESSLTGHLVMSTLHTNSAAETVTRLLDMGMDPFNFADSLLAVLAQRLVRRICPKCRQSTPIGAEPLQELVDDYLHAWGEAENRPNPDALIADWTTRFGRDGKLLAWRSPGCDHCEGSGFRGRAGLHELLSVSRGVRHLIQTGSRAELIQAQAIAEGMRTLRQDGIEKVLQGITTIEEVRATSNT
ncbi:GspE/PulE family protein [Ideonella alba]|uniref:GspE/PulE family protein n=1 Tax=Ideonella alba TaxID=2824118 RepID=UPI001FFCBD36|nr:ATPase, T2SS/T4P/T4SS family [Ideonella alba]